MQKELSRLGIADLDELNSELTRLGMRPPPAWNSGPGMRPRGTTPPPPPRKNFSPLRSGSRDTVPSLHTKAWRPGGTTKRSPRGKGAAAEEEQGSGSPQSPYSPDTWAAELKVLTQTNHTETGHSGLAEQLWGSFAIEEGQVPADVETTEECVRLLERIGRPTEHLTSRRP